MPLPEPTVIIGIALVLIGLAFLIERLVSK